MDDFAQLLRETIGLDSASVGMSSIERAVQQRVVMCHAGGPREYLQHLRADPAEVQALVETVVVSETWFFRDPKAFGVVADRVLSSSLRERLHFLSIPCSTGEEPYSLAMALLDRGVPPDRFQIDAMDVSERVLAIARAGIYGRNSFRGRDLLFRDRHLQQTPEGYELDPAVRKLVRFQQGNLLDENAMAGRGRYDAIFCRNLLIYLDAEAQRHATTALLRILADDGFLFTGPAEMGLLLPFDVEPTRISLAFAFQKGKVCVTEAERTKLSNRRPATAKGLELPRTVAGRSIAARSSAPHPPAISKGPSQAQGDSLPRTSVVSATAPPHSAPDLSKAVRLADEGRLDEVAAICHAAIKQGGASAEAFYLLGIVSDAAGRADEAATHYRKALYLNPQHHDALLHYSLLTAKRGDATAAQVLRERARRCKDQAA